MDDLKSLPAWSRLIAQFAVATLVVVLSGGRIRIASAFGHFIFPAWLAIIMTILWIVGVVNTFNWIDGLDGLAAGIGAISALAFFVIVAIKPGLPNAPLTAALCAMLIGAVMGFLPYNFFPAKTFIGDGGAFSLGYLLAVISVVGLFKQAAVVGFVLPVVVLALPITDTLFAILRRAHPPPADHPARQQAHPPPAAGAVLAALPPAPAARDADSQRRGAAAGPAARTATPCWRCMPSPRSSPRRRRPGGDGLGAGSGQHAVGSSQLTVVSVRNEHE